MSALRNDAGPQPWSGSRERSRQIGYAQAMGQISKLIRFDLKGMEPAQALAAVQEYTDSIYVLGLIPVLTMSELDGCLGWGNPDRPRQLPGGAR
jgi:hypothetical protein